MIYHYFLVDMNDNGYMYRIGVKAEKTTSLKEIVNYFKQYSKDVLYEYSTLEVDKKYLKTMKTIPCGYIFTTKFLFDKCMRVDKDHWSCKLRRSLLDKQDGEVHLS